MAAPLPHAYDADAMHSYEPRSGHGLPHDPLTSLVAPRPIGWISTLSAQGTRNLAPYSFFNLFNYTPPILGFCSNGAKDTLRNVRETGEFCWNLATRPLAEAMNLTSSRVPPGVDEFSLAGLSARPSQRVRPPGVGQSPVTFECKVTQIVQLQTTQQTPVSSWLVLGEAVAVHIARERLVNGIYDTASAEPILRGGGLEDYFAIGAEQRFLMARPPA
jgi:flavin reductase (DIM6/NTAB) family NADH-FMN oxidoreductase RutF